MENIMPQMSEAANFEEYFKNNTQLGPEVVEEYFSKRLKEDCQFDDYSNLYFQLENGHGSSQELKNAKKVLYYDGDFSIVLAKNLDFEKKREEIINHLDDKISIFGIRLGRFFIAKNDIKIIESKIDKHIPLATISADLNREKTSLNIKQLQISKYTNTSIAFSSGSHEPAEILQKRIFQKLKDAIEDKEIFNFRWEMALIEAMLDLGEKFGIENASIQPSRYNTWKNETRRESMYKRYDITAKRYRDSKGRRFFQDEKTHHWILRTN